MSVIDDAAELLCAAKRVAVLSGAGISKESGIPTFRDAQTGLWANYDPQQLASPSGFRNNPKLVWQWYDSRRQRLAEVQANPGHFALAELASMFEEFTVITQNVDGLHQKAGSRGVIELHGNITTFRCFERGHESPVAPLGLAEPPLCHCGSFIRPAVVWFGEGLPEGVFQQALVAAQSSDVFLIVGTSGLVYPAASLPSVAAEAGAKLIEINRERTPISEFADVFIGRESGKALPEVLHRCKEKRSSVR
ncbi:MAG TPA: NAD-dependent deacylase [Oculatellaceae cyanobacterium]